MKRWRKKRGLKNVKRGKKQKGTGQRSVGDEVVLVFSVSGEKTSLAGWCLGLAGFVGFQTLIQFRQKQFYWPFNTTTTTRKKRQKNAKTTGKTRRQRAGVWLAQNGMAFVSFVFYFLLIVNSLRDKHDERDKQRYFLNSPAELHGVKTQQTGKISSISSITSSLHFLNSSLSSIPYITSFSPKLTKWTKTHAQPTSSLSPAPPQWPHP